MIKTNSEKVAQSIRDASAKIEKKLNGMVQEFVYKTAEDIQNITPIGDASFAVSGQKLHDGKSTTQTSKYLMRPAGWVQEPGLTRGNWMVSATEQGIEFDSMQNSSSKALANILHTTETFKLGDKIYLGNATPYLMNEFNGGALEHGYSKQAPNGISKPLVALVGNIYATDLKHFYQIS